MSRPAPHDRWVIALFSVLFFLGCLVLVRVAGIYVSPDETANAFFATTFAERGVLEVHEPLNLTFSDALHPRSVVSVGGRLLPGSFIGLPVMYGAFAALVGAWSIPLVTPIVAVLVLFAWYGTVKRIFDREIALLSAVLLAIHPAWWYYSARSLMHNVLFVALLVFAAYFFVARPPKGRLADAGVALSGMLTGLALFVRTSEAVWMAAAALAAALLFRKRISRRVAAVFLCSAFLALAPMFFLNRATYGSPLATGYTAERTPAAEEEGATVADAAEEAAPAPFPFEKIFFPFGLSAKDTAKNVLAYGMGLFWWMTLLTAIGIPLAYPARSVPAEARQARRAYLLSAAVATLYLAFLYGSWTFFDNPDKTQVTIGNSHVRYWLPVFVLSTPLAAFAVRWISRRAFTDLARRLAVAAMVVACFGLSVRVAFFSPQDGLVQAAAELADSRDIRTRVLALTEEDAVIVVDRADKLFFPYRRVLYPLRDEATYALMPRIVLRVPLYYYGITLPPVDVEYLNADKLASLGLRIEAVETFGIETLYRITRRD